MNKLQNILGSNIRKYREMQGLTQEQFSEKLGLNTSSISDIECGKRFPKPENLVKIAQLLNVSYELLFLNETLEQNKIMDDFNQRIEVIKNDPEKFTILYNYLKVLM